MSDQLDELFSRIRNGRKLLSAHEVDTVAQHVTRSKTERLMNVATKHYLGSELFITLEHQALNEPPKALTTSNSNYYSRRNNFLKRFNKVEEPFEPYLL